MRVAWLFVALTSGLVAQAQETKIIYSSDPKIQKTAESFWMVANSREPDGSFFSKRLEATPGVHRTPFGLQVDPHCFEVAGAKTPAAIQAWKDGFDLYVEKSVNKVMGDCWKNYRELGTYVTEWARRLSRTLVSCTELSMTEMKAGGFNAGSVSGITVPDYLKAAEKKRLQGFKDTPDATAKAGRPLIIFPAEIAVSMGRTFSLYAIDDTLVHEGFHSTTANNLENHNHVERLPASASCDTNASVDRVCVIASLCTGVDLPHHGSGDSAQNVLYARMNKCGRHQACELTFKNEYTSPDGSQKKKPDPLSRGLLADSAAALCDQIFNEGCCRDFMNTAGGRKQVLSRPEVTKVTNRVLKRMDEVLPKKANHIPAAAIKSFPDILETFQSLQKSECFQAFFEGTVDTGISVKGEADRELDEEERYGDGYNWPKMLAAAASKIERGKNCHDNAHVEWLQGAMTRMSERMSKAMNSSTFSDQIMPRKFSGVERAVNSWDAPGSDQTKYMMQLMDGKYKLESLAGPSLYWDYWKVINRYHPSGNFFNCSALDQGEYAMLGCFGKLKGEPAPFCQAD